MPHVAAGDSRFFPRRGPFRLAEIAKAAGATPPPHGADRVFTGVAPLAAAGPDHVSFLDNPRYAAQLDATGAGAVLLQAACAPRLPAGCASVVTPTPYLGWARVCALFHPPPPLRPGAHPSAVADPAAVIDSSAEIGACAVIGPGATIGPHCRIGPHAVIGDGVVLGAGCDIGAHVSLSHALLGARVRILPGARIGQDGFGFAPDGAGGYVTVPQLGRVIIEDDVEIGANTTIDRGSMRDTRIGRFSRLDNLVQIAHNVQLGEGCVIVSQAGISGSTVLGHHVQVAGQAGLTGHLSVGNLARIGAQAGVMHDVPEGASIVGSPAQDSVTFFREIAALRKIVARERAGLKRQPDPA